MVAEALAVPGIIPPTVRLYPLVDHLADKISATRTVFRSGRPSSRVRDMVDLALFALTQPVDGGATIRRIGVLVPYADFDDARELLARFLDPALAGEVEGCTWNPSTLTWEQK